MYSRPEEVAEYLKTKFAAQQVALGIAYIGMYDETLIPKYPAMVISPGPTAKTIVGTHKFEIQFRTIIWVYHARLTLTHQQRSLADLQLASAITALLDADIQMSDNVIHSYVESEVPGVIQPRTTKSDAVVGTRLSHWALAQKMF